MKPRILTSSWTLFPLMDPIAAARFSAAEGFAGMELECQSLDFWPEMVGEPTINEMKAIAAGEGIFYTIHAPDEISPATRMPQLRQSGDRTMIETIKLGARIGAPLICLHPGTADELRALQRHGRPFETDRYERNALLAEAICRSTENISHWASQAADWGIKLAVENDVHVAFSIVTEVAVLKRIVNDISRDNVVVVFDTGHAFIAGGVETELDILKPLIRHIHLNDNHTNISEHLPLGEGLIDFGPVISLIKETQPTLVLELYAPDRPIEATIASRDYVLESMAITG